MTYDLGDVARLSASFSDINGAPADPTAVTVTVKDPSGATNTYGTPNVVHDSLGNYHFDQDCNVVGTWKYQFDGTGLVKASGPGSFRVREREV